jgi:hypothetical protein
MGADEITKQIHACQMTGFTSRKITQLANLLSEPCSLAQPLLHDAQQVMFQFYACKR